MYRLMVGVIDNPTRHVTWRGEVAPIQFALTISGSHQGKAVIGKVSTAYKEYRLGTFFSCWPFGQHRS